MKSGSESLKSLAPLEVVLSLDHTDGVIPPGLDHVAHSGDGNLLGVILQYVIIIAIFTKSTCIINGLSWINYIDFTFEYRDRPRKDF